MFEEGRVPARESAGPISRCTTCGPRPRPRSASRLRDRRTPARITARRSCHTLIGAVRKATGRRARSRLDDDRHRHRHDETTLNELGGCFGYVSRPDIRRGGGAGPPVAGQLPVEESVRWISASARQRCAPSPTVGGWREGHLVVVLEDEGRRIVAQGGETHSTLWATFVVRALAAGPQQCHARAACPFGGARRCHSRGCRVVLWVQVILDQGVDDDPDPHPVRAQSLGGAGAAWASPS